MKILMPFPYLEIFDRYFNQMRAIRKNLDEFHVAYFSGNVKKEWERHFIFHHAFDYPYEPKKVGWTKRLQDIPHLINRQLFYKKQVLERLKNIDVDLYFTLSSYLHQETAEFLAKHSKKPFIVRVRGNLRLELKIKQPFAIRAFYLSSLFQNLKKAKLIIPISERVRKNLVEWGLNPDLISEPIHLGVDLKRFHLLYARKDSSILKVGYAGRLSQEKGIVRLIDLAKELPTVQFYLAGRKQVSLDMPNNVKYLGRIPHEKMIEFYNSIDLVLLPSFTEGFPNVVLEAYACGKPILATPEAFPSELKIFGTVAPFQRWKEKIENFGVEREMRLDARNYVEEYYGWDIFGKKMVGEFQKVLE